MDKSFYRQDSTPPPKATFVFNSRNCSHSGVPYFPFQFGDEHLNVLFTEITLSKHFRLPFS